MSSTVDGIAAVILGFIVVGSAFGMLSTRNVVHAAFWMLSSMLGTAGIYVLLSASFLALVQVMVYAGAVAVLLLFVIMLTLRRREDAVRSRDFSWPALGLTAIFGFGSWLAIREFSPAEPVFPGVAPGIEAFGEQLFTTWMLPFELASLLLTIALVGAIWWSTGGKDK